MRVAILGGGIGGLSCAYYAQRAGLRATVFEASDRGGLLSQRFESGAHGLDCFHDPLSRNDLALCGLLAELGLLHRMIWREVETAAYREGEVRAMENGEQPLLRGLPRWDRLRAGVASVLCSRWLQPEAELQRTPASVWLARYYGARAYEQVWGPLLRARFGEHADEIPASVVSRFLRGLFSERRELRGYLLGGWSALCERLRQSLVEGGAQLRFGRPVRGIQIDAAPIASGGIGIATDQGLESFDAAISTLPLADLAKIAPAQLLSSLPPCAGEPRGALSAVALLRRRPALPYRVLDLSGELGFEQVVCAGQLLPAASTGPLSPVYLTRHCSMHGDVYCAPDEELGAAAIGALARLDPGLRPEHVESVRVFRAPHVAPPWRVGSGLRREPLRAAGAPLYLWATPQAYPGEAGSEASVVLARETVRRVGRDHLHVPLPGGVGANALQAVVPQTASVVEGPVALGESLEASALE